jgi:tetratricopeptide (TPR) repeat protein
MALNAAGSLAFHETDYPAARTLLEQSLALSRALADRRCIAHVLNNLGAVAFEQGAHPAARGLYEESLALLRELGGPTGNRARWKGQRRSLPLGVIHSPPRARGALRSECARR